MAVVGDAYIVVRAITTGFQRDVERAFRGMPNLGNEQGREMGEQFSRGFQRSVGSGGGFSKAFKNIAREASAARQEFQRLIRVSYTLGPALASIVGGVGSLIGGFVSLGSAVAGAIPSLVVIPGIIAAAIQSVLTLGLAFSGVFAAISAGQKKQAASSAKVEKDLSGYRRRIADAERNLARTIERNRETLVDANRRVTEAQQDLTKAIEQGREEIQQLGFDAEDAVLSEKRAALELEKARANLMRVQDLPPNSRARKEAELAYNEADLALRRATDKSGDLAKEQDRLAKEGVDGTEVVQRAKAALYEAELDRNRAIRDAARAEADAVRDLTRARKDLNKAMKDGPGGGGGSDPFADAMSKLSKEAQSFVNFILEKFIPAVDKLKKAAGKELFPKLEIALQNLIDNLFPRLQPLLRKTGGALGDVAIKISEVITQEENLKDLETIFETGIHVIKRFGDVAAGVYDSALSVLAAADPVIRRFSDFLANKATDLAEYLDLKQETGQLTEFFNKSGDIAAQLGGIIGNVASSITNIIKANLGPGSGGQLMLDWLTKITQEWENWTGSEEGQTRMKEFFRNTAENSIKILEAVGAFAKELIKLGESPSVGVLADTLKGAAPIVGEILGKFQDGAPALGNFLVKFAEFINLTTDSGAIQVFWQTLTDIAQVLIDFFSNPQVNGAFVWFAKIAAVMSALGLAWTVIKLPIMSVIGLFTQIGGVFSGVRGALKKLAPVLGTTTGGLLRFAGIAGAVIGLFIALWQNSEIFREAVKKLVSGVFSKLVEVFKDLREKLDGALEPFGGLSGAFKTLGDVLGRYVLPVIGWVLEKLITLVGFLLGKAIEAIGLLWKAWKWVWDKIYVVIETVVNWFKRTAWPAIQKFTEAVGKFFTDLWKTVKDVWDKIYGAIETVVNWFKTYVWPAIDLYIRLMAGAYNTLWKAIQWVWNQIYAKIEEVVKWFQNTAWPIIQKVADFIKDKFETVKNKIETAWGLIKTAIDKVATWFSGTLWPIFERIYGNLTSGIETAKRTISGVWDEIKNKVNIVTGLISGYLEPVWKPLSSALSTAWSTVKGTWQTISSTIFGTDGWVTKFKNGIASIWNGLTSGLQAAWAATKTWWNNNVGGKGFTIDVPDFVGKDINVTIPKLAAGGVVPATRGGQLALIGEAGRAERVEPLDSDGLSQRDRAIIKFLAGKNGSPAGGGMTFNIFPSEGMDERELASIISREIAFQMRRGA